MIDAHLRGGAAAEALDEAAALLAALRDGALVHARRLAGPIYYALRALHALQRWEDMAALVEDEGAFIAALGSQHHAYACALMMEASHHRGAHEEIPRHALDCCQRRLADGDAGSLRLALETAHDLLGVAARPDLAIALDEALIDLGAEEGPTSLAPLAVGAQRRALETAERSRDEALLSTARDRATARRDLWPTLGRRPDSGAAEWLLELAASDWFLARLPPDERYRVELGERLLAPASEGDVAALARVLEAAGDPNLADAAGRTALSIAALAGHETLVAALLTLPLIDPGRANVQGRTPLTQAADRDHGAICTRLLAAGADPDPRDLNGQTPLMVAAWQSRESAVAALLAGGADVTLRDRAGLTAADWAEREGFASLAATLRT